MWSAIAFAMAAFGGYLLGSIPFGLVLTRMAGLGDIREIGSKNIGATNVLRTGRKDLAAATLVLDAAKAGIAALIFWWLLGYEAGLVAGGAAFLGHCFPVWLNFKGGKGVATFFGTILAVAWPVGVLAALVWIGMALLMRMSSLSALVAAAAAPVIAYAFDKPGVALLSLFLAVLIYWRHRANIARILAGEEPRIGRKPA
ncbi:glycerol-3-phosphate 1-O-acyltransferase PlsY [Hyphobacterium marinum]